MFRKSVKKTSVKKHSAVPVAEAAPKAPPKKAAEVTAIVPAKSAVIAETPAKAQTTEKVTVAAPASIKAADTIGGVLNRAAVPAAIAALRSSDADIARDAALSLGGIGDASAVEPLIEVLKNTDGYYHGVVRAAAASSLAQLRDVRAFEALRGAVRDEMAEASAEAVRALAAMGDKRAVVELIDIVRNPTGYFLNAVRLAAVVGLGQLGGDQAAAELQRVASDCSEDAVIGETARQALATRTTASKTAGF